MNLLHSVVNGIQKVSKNLDDQKELRNKKTRVLKRLSLKQLQYMAKNYNITIKPGRFSDIIENKRPTITDHIVCIRSNLSYEEILDYAKKRNIDVSDILQEEKEKKLTMVKDTSSATNINENLEGDQEGEVSILYSNIKQKIQAFSLDFAINSEDEFEKHLFQYLKYQFPNFEIQRQVPCGDGDKVDIVISAPDPGFEVAIELKLGTNKNHLRNARAQVEDYSKFFNFTMLVVLDIGNLEQTIYEDLENKIQVQRIDFILLEGQLTERKSVEVRKKERIIKELIKN
ncbi:hypothetical protein MSBRW_2498 [Methanosarcina barkeri str. Wiesmoor]|uniref:Uncharacterized protein n=2 Tax=Methanosarcina barkeri TaxID=2208 RepID=A0A0E3LLR9_METBA|nr:hypothetical protein [Methanosarcina barkeri]AKB51751.1 hypothetical protein MSBRW_2498 [Methanosarcina barkeri str. Wiesmoor]